MITFGIFTSKLCKGICYTYYTNIKRFYEINMCIIFIHIIFMNEINYVNVWYS